jgi:hypothetical protein
MAVVVFPTASAIANTVPLNGNTVPISGIHGIANHTEMFLYAALSLENILLGDEINFGRGTLPSMSINDAKSQSGELYKEVIAYVRMEPNYATFPNGEKLWKHCIERLPNNPANIGFNF